MITSRQWLNIVGALAALLIGIDLQAQAFKPLQEYQP